MRIDIPTISAIVPLVYSINIIISLALYISRRTFKGAFHWILGQVCLSLAFVGMAIRPLLPSFLSVTMVNILFLTSMLLYANSLWNFRFEKLFPVRCYLAIPILAPLFFTVQDSSFAVRAIVFSAFMAATSLFNAIILLYKVEPEYRTSNFITAIPFFLITIVNIIRVPMNISPAPLEDAGAQTTFNTIYYMFAIGVASFTLFGYFMMTMTRADRELRELNRVKDVFISILAHDLRSPIAGAARFARKHILNSREDLERKWAAIGTLTTTLERISAFLEKLLWFSRTQQDEWKPEPESVELSAAIRAAASVYQSEAAVKAIRLELPKHAEDLRIFANQESVSLILLNLISNAVKFSPMGGKVLVSVMEKGEGILTAVEDHGTGINREVIPLLFKLETKQTRRGTEGEEGSGLGLILCKALVDRNAGKLEIESEPGKGTRISFWMPKPPR